MKLKTKNFVLLAGGIIIGLYITAFWLLRLPHFFWIGMPAVTFFRSLFIVFLTGTMLMMVWYAVYQIRRSSM